MKGQRIASHSSAVSKLKPKQPKDAIEGGDPVKGKSIYLNCMGCHGQKAEGMVFMHAPSLVHVEGWYMLEQLKKFNPQRGAEDISKYVPTDPLFLSATQTNASAELSKQLSQTSKQ